MDRKIIKQRMVEIFNDYAMDKNESEVVIDMYFVKKNGEHQHKTLSWESQEEENEIKFYCAAELEEMDALDLLFDSLPETFRNLAKQRVLSQYEKKEKKS